MKKLLTIVLVAIAIGGVVMAIWNRQAGTGKDVTGPLSSGTSPTQAEVAPSHVVKVTYFTTNVRCPSCLKIEELTRLTVENRFSQEVTNGELVFQLINTDLPENRHFIKDYQLVSKTVVVAEFDDGMQGDWLNLQDVWLKFTDPEDFEKYVAEAITQKL